MLLIYTLQTIAQFFAVGAYATRIPNAPRVSQDQANLMLALPDRPSRDAFVEFFMVNNQHELKYGNNTSRDIHVYVIYT